MSQATVSITPNASAAAAGNSLSQVLSPAFAGMGIEPSNLFSFAGGYHGNQLSLNLLANLANNTGVPPHLRIGGNTGDYMIYNSSYTEYNLFTNPDPMGPGTIPSDLYTFGPTFFEALNRFPVGTPITYGLNLAYDLSDSISNVVAEAAAAQSMLTQAVLVSFEIGNEPDLYAQNGFRTGSWGPTTFATEWLARADAVYKQVLAPNNLSANFFEPATTADIFGSFGVASLVDTTSITAKANITSNNTAVQEPTSYVAAFNEHDYFYYIGIDDYPITLDYLMDLSKTVTQFGAWTTQISQSIAAGYPYVLREMASVGPIGLQGISDTFGAALWTLNFFLYAATLNVSSVQLHMTDDSWAAAWAPIPKYGMPAHVRSSYYAFATVSQLIGGQCNTQVSPMPITQYPSGYANRLGAYSTYQGGNLAALVLLNTLQSNISNTNKGSVNWQLSLPSLAGQTLYLSYLTADGADATFNTTWNGISYEQNSIGQPTTVGNATTVVVGSNGAVSIPVRDSEAVVANVGHQIGTGASGQYNRTSCLALAAEPASELPTTDPVPSASATSPADKPASTSGPDALNTGKQSSSSAADSLSVSAAVALTAAAALAAAMLAL